MTFIESDHLFYCGNLHFPFCYTNEVVGRTLIVEDRRRELLKQVDVNVVGCGGYYVATNCLCWSCRTRDIQLLCYWTGEGNHAPILTPRLVIYFRNRLIDDYVNQINRHNSHKIKDPASLTCDQESSRTNTDTLQ
jgi:hypothetical protein